MNTKVKSKTGNWMASPWMRVLVFLWGIVFPIVFVALPALEMLGKERPVSMDPVWALALWVLSPLAVSIGLKYFRAGSEAEK